MAWSNHAAREPSPEELLRLDIDLRLEEPWRTVFELEEFDDDLVGALLRLAYGIGYHDALTESEPGKLYRDHGWEAPSP